MKLLAAFGLLAVAFAAWQPSEREFSNGKQYEFEWNGQISSGVPVKGSSAHSFRQISAKAIITVSDKHFWLHVKDVRMQNGQRRLAEPRLLSSAPSMESLLSSEQSEQLALPVRFRYHHGLVTELHFAEQDGVWSENIKRAILNMFQLNLSAKKNEQSTENENKFFTAQERTIEGDCEVAYTINKGNKDETEVTKSINFDKCQKRVDIRYGLRFSTDCPECEKRQDARPDSQTVISYKIAGSEARFLIKEVELKSEYVFSPMTPEQSMLATYVHHTMRLVKVTQAKKIEEPRMGKKGSLFYNYETELAREQFWMTGSEEAWKKAGFEQAPKKELVVKYVKNLLKSKESEKTGVQLENTHEMARIVDTLLMCNKNEMVDIHHAVCENSELEENEKKMLNEIMADALAIAGTKVTVEHLIEKIEKRQIGPIKAALTLKTLVNIRVPSENIVDSVLRLSKSKIAREEPVLRQSCLLTAGALMNGLCGQNKDMWAVEIDGEKKCPREIKTEWLSQLKTLFAESQTRYEKVLALKTLANAGMDISIHFLEDIIYNKKEEQTIRLQAVDALRMLREQMPRKVQNVLMPIFKSRSELSALRMAAILQIVHSRPARVLLDQVVEQLNKERDQQVRSFTYTLLRSFTESENPCEKQLSADIQVSLRMLRNPPPVLASRHMHQSIYSKLFDLGVSTDFASGFSNESSLPQELLASLDTLFAGQWNKNLVQVGFSQQNLDSVILPLLKKLENVESEVVVRGQRSSKQPMKMVLREIFSKLNIVGRQSEEGEQFGMLYIRYKNLDYAVLPMEQELINKIVRNGKVQMDDVLRQLAKGFRFDSSVASFVYEYVRVIPTSVGLPLIVSQKMPTLAAIKGSFKVDMTPKIAVRVLAEPSVAATHIFEMQLVSPSAHTGVRMLHSVQSTLPLDAIVEYNYERNQLKTIVKLPKTEKRLLVLETRPACFVRNFHRGIPKTEEKTVYITKLDRTTVHYEKTYGRELLGLKTEIIGSVHRHIFEEKSPKSVLFGENHIQINVIPTEEAVREVVIEIEPRFNKEHEMENPRYDETFTKEEFLRDGSEETEYESEQEYSARHHESRKYYRNLKISKAYEGRLVAKIYTVGGPQPLKGQVVVRSACVRDLRHCQMELIAKRSPLLEESREWEMRAVVDYVLPESPKSLEQLREQKHREIQGTIELVWGAEAKNELKIKLQGEQDRKMEKLIRQLSVEKQGLSDYETLVEAARLNKISIMVNHDLSKKNEKVFETVYDLLKSYYFMESEITPIRRQKGSLLIKLTVEPEQCRRMNFTIETAEEKMIVRETTSPLRLPLPSIAAQLPINKLHKLGRSECEVRSTRVNTFDNLLYKAPLTTCYSVLAKDCSDEPEYAIMIKKVSKNSEEKKMKIITEEAKIELELVDDEIVCTINGKRVNDEELLSENGISRPAERVVEVELRRVSVHFDGYTAQLLADSRTQNTQCGLCGHFDGQSDNEFRRADNQETDDIEEFHRSWLSRDSECEIEEQKLKEKKNYKIESEEEFETESEERDLPRERMQKKNRNPEEETYEPEMKTLVLERESKTCFSMEPQSVCEDGEIEESESKKVRFVCLSRSQPATRRLAQQARREGSVDVSRFEHSVTDRITLPTLCRAY